MVFSENLHELKEKGYTIINNVYSVNEIESMSIYIENYEPDNNLVVNKDLFVMSITAA